MASRLIESQKALGHDAWMVNAISSTLRQEPLAKPLHTLAAAVDDYVVKARSFSAPISLWRDRLSVDVKREVASADVIHVHWPHGMIRPKMFSRVFGSTPVVWTLHDMHLLNSVCHYTLGDRGCVQVGEHCEAVRALFRASAQSHLHEKKHAIASLSRLALVSPSHWLAREATLSETLRGRKVSVVPNPLPPQTPGEIDSDLARSQLGVSETATVFVLMASSLGDPVKAVPEAIDGFISAASGSGDAILILAGAGSPRGQHPQVKYVGFLDFSQRNRVLAAADYLLVPSLAENQPLSISEAQAMGVSIIVRNTTGLPEHLDIDPEGRAFENAESISGLLRDLIDNGRRGPQERAALAKAAHTKFDPTLIAQKYLEIYQ